ncbi:hypothetical protein [Carboxylicivirga sp. M1479]|uniref:hypothetical protein n=1 Tax=Carboxylicivirga sp. M1479 TaxID=2594476 RepID=UPI001177FDFF|nr:hypothetical protein [Carboxylicivirga sp. M1479]TRX72071.1 hypothetical protein FNN09_03440 [Carboxylicivirga sp. M1479]
MILLILILVKLLSPELASAKVVNTSLCNTNDNNWAFVKEKNKIKLYERWITLNDSQAVRERKGELLTTCSFDLVEKYLRNCNTASEWFIGIKSIDSFSDSSHHLLRINIELPWPFTNRELIARYSFFKTDSKHSVIKVMSTNNYHQQKKQNKHYEASWTIERISDELTKITFKTFSNEAPKFPQWIQEPVIKKVFTNNLLRLKKRLSEL